VHEAEQTDAVLALERRSEQGAQQGAVGTCAARELAVIVVVGARCGAGQRAQHEPDARVPSP